MEKRNYTHVQMLLPEIEAMMAERKTQREKRRKLEAGIVPRPKGRPATEQAYEIARLRMENKLLRDFLQFAERK